MVNKRIAYAIFCVVLYNEFIPKLREEYDESSPGNLIERFKKEAEKDNE